MKINYKWKKILSTVLAVVVLVGTVGLIASIATNDRSSADAVFKIGALDEQGEYMSDDASIYTRESFPCYGLKVEPTFESEVTYDIYYYDSDGVFLKSVKGLSKDYTFDFTVAENCRIVIHPEVPEDVDYDSFKIHIWDILKYSKQLKITVDKHPDKLINYTNLWDDNNVIANSYITLTESVGENIDDVKSDSAGVGYKLSPKIELSKNIDGIYIALEAEYPPDSYAYVSLADQNGIVVRTYILTVSEALDGNTWYARFCPEENTESWRYMRVAIYGTSMDNVHVYTYIDN